MDNDKPSFLGALGVAKHPVTVNGCTIILYGLSVKEAAQLLESFGRLPAAARGVVKLLAPSGDEQEYFTTDYSKLSGAACGWLSELLAVSLRVDVADIEEVATAHLPVLLEGVVEANQAFFTDASRLLTRLSERAPALQSLLAGLIGAKPSPESSATAGA